MRWYLVVLLVILLGVSLYANTKNTVEKPRGYKCLDCNVVILTIEAFRADRVASMGYTRNITKNLDSFGSENFLFTRAYVNAPWTLPSLASLLTGKYPSRHGVLGPKDRLNEDMTTLADILKAQGYTTAYAYNAWFPLDNLGFGQGFDSKKIGGNADSLSRYGMGIMAGKTKKRFLWIHYVEPHLPYNPPGEYATKFIDDIPSEYRQAKRSTCMNNDYNISEIEYFKALYDGEIEYTDNRIGGLIEYLDKNGLYNKTIIVILGDHGEEFWEHDSCDHGQSHYEELVHVPLFIRIPTIDGGMRISQRVQEVDIVPTILDTLNMSTDELDGISLVPMILGERKDERPIFIEAIHPVYSRPQNAIVYKSFKLIHKPKTGKFIEKWELYDLSKDPDEREDLEGGTNNASGEMKPILKRFESIRGRVPERIDYPKETEERLRNIGYL